MIEAQLFRDDGIVEVFPSGTLKAVDFQQLAALVDPYIEANGDLKGLIIVADRFPGWADFDALVGHIRFVRAHHTHIRRIAVVSDGVTLSVLPQLAKHVGDRLGRNVEPCGEIAERERARPAHKREPELPLDSRAVHRGDEAEVRRERVLALQRFSMPSSLARSLLSASFFFRNSA